jgi:enoyl-CoA hydratase/carnithine racemase
MDTVDGIPDLPDRNQTMHIEKTTNDSLRTLVSVEQVASTAVIRLEREDRRNALSTELIAQVVGAIEEANEQEQVRGIVLCGAGTAFSAGADLNEALEVRNAHGTLRYLNRLRRLTTAIELTTKPVVAAIHGPCITGGLETALACDRRIASSDATFSISSARIGSVAGLGGTQRLPRLVGPSVANDLLMTGRIFDAEEALRLGVVDEVVESGAAVETACAWVEQVAESAPLSVWLAKMAVQVGSEISLDKALQLEALLTALAFTTDDRAEGMSAILEKRKPKFNGK